MCFLFKSYMFRYIIDHHQAKKHTVIKRQVKMQYTKHNILGGIPEFYNVFVHNKIVKFLMVDGK